MAEKSRPPPSPPINAEELATSTPPRRIKFRHPAYPDAHPLLSLPALDGSPQPGLDYDFALVACGIVAGNRWHGACFSRRNTTSPSSCPSSIHQVARPADDILRDTDYFFHPAGPHDVTVFPNSERYAVVPNFAAWQYPHCLPLPSPWAQLQLSQYIPSSVTSSPREVVLARDETCRLSASAMSLEHAHLVPRDEILWFEYNDMSRYTLYTGADRSIDDPTNAITFRKDVRSLFDNRQFVLVPCGSDAPRSVKVHVLDGRLSGEAIELRHLYHHVQLQSLCGVATEFLFARLAWSILDPDLYQLTRTPGESFSLVLRDGIRPDVAAADIYADPRLAPTGPKSRSASPKKRRRSEHSQTGKEEELADAEMGYAEWYWLSLRRHEQQRRRGSDPHIHLHSPETSPPRGRKRRRSVETSPPAAWSRPYGIAPSPP